MKKLLFFILSIFILQSGFGQDSITTKSPHHYYFSISPQYIIINGTRVEFEKRFKESIHAIVFAPTWYLGSIGENHLFSNSFREYEINGFGIEIGHKIYSEKSWVNNVNWYQSYSLTLNHLVLDYLGTGWFPLPDEPDFLINREAEQKLTINQFAISTVFGAVVPLDKNFYTDVYIGIGAKRSKAEDTSSNNFAEEELNQGFLSYNFTGALFRTGFKIGYAF